MTSSEAKAIAAIDSLVVERDAAKGRITFWQTKADKAEQERDTAKRHAANAEARALFAEKRVLDLEDRLYGGTARAFNSYFYVEREYRPEYMADHISIRSQMANLMLPRRDVFDARQPLEVIDSAIKRIVGMHSEHLTKQLREAVWPRR